MTTNHESRVEAILAPEQQEASKVMYRVYRVGIQGKLFFLDAENCKKWFAAFKAGLDALPATRQLEELQAEILGRKGREEAYRAIIEKQEILLAGCHEFLVDLRTNHAHTYTNDGQGRLNKVINRIGGDQNG